MNSIMSIKDKINFEKFYLYATLFFAFTLPLSRTAVSFFILLLPIVFILEGNFKSKFKLIIEEDNQAEKEGTTDIQC